MADYFHNKDYNEYFEKLNSRIDLGEKTAPSKHKSRKTRAKRRKKAPRFMRGALSVLLVTALLIVAVVVLTSGHKNDAPLLEKGVASETAKTEPKEEKTRPIAYKSDSETVEIPENCDAKTAVVVRLSDGKIIAQRGADERIYPASTLKIMTLLVAAENMKSLDDTFTMSYDITDPLYLADASVAGFKNGEEITVEDMLYGMILPSGADAATGLAVKIAGSEEEFVKLMNKRVEEMGLKGTHFTNVSGLFDKDNYSTAYDMAVITEYAFRNELCRKVLSTYQYTTKKTPQNPDGITLSSTLFSYIYGDEPVTAEVLGGKTGYVNESGYCISTFGKNKAGTEEYIIVTMGSSSKWPAFYGQIDLYKEFAK